MVVSTQVIKEVDPRTRDLAALHGMAEGRDARLRSSARNVHFRLSASVSMAARVERAIRDAMPDDRPSAVLSDLRLELKGRAVVVDHVAILPGLAIVVCSRGTRLTMTRRAREHDGSWTYNDGVTDRRIGSPIEQAQAAGDAVRKVLPDLDVCVVCTWPRTEEMPQHAEIDVVSTDELPAAVSYAAGHAGGRGGVMAHAHALLGADLVPGDIDWRGLIEGVVMPAARARTEASRAALRSVSRARLSAPSESIVLPGGTVEVVVADEGTLLLPKGDRRVYERLGAACPKGTWSSVHQGHLLAIEGDAEKARARLRLVAIG